MVRRGQSLSFSSALATRELARPGARSHGIFGAGRLAAERLSWVSGSPPGEGARLAAKVRYRQADQPCVVREVGGGRMLLEFEEPQRAVTAGQSVVLYEGEECLGGGIIAWANTPPAMPEKERAEVSYA